MKKQFLFIFFAIVIFSCSNSNSPKSVVAAFLKGLEAFDYPEVEKHCTPRYAKYLSAVISMGAKNTANEGLPKILRDSIVGDRAYVFVQNRKNTNLEDIVLLAKIDGKWKVDLPSKK